MVETVEIRGNFDRQDGNAAVSGTLFFRLDKRDFDGATIVEPGEQTVDLDASGTFTGVNLWPNDRGRIGSRYNVGYTPDGGKRETIIGNLFVPETGGPHELADLIFATQIATASKLPAMTPITQAQYDAKLAAGTLADGLYLIEVA